MSDIVVVAPSKSKRPFFNLLLTRAYAGIDWHERLVLSAIISRKKKDKTCSHRRIVSITGISHRNTIRTAIRSLITKGWIDDQGQPIDTGRHVSKKFKTDNWMTDVVTLKVNRIEGRTDKESALIAFLHQIGDSRRMTWRYLSEVLGLSVWTIKRMVSGQKRRDQKSGRMEYIRGLEDDGIIVREVEGIAYTFSVRLPEIATKAIVKPSPAPAPKPEPTQPMSRREATMNKWPKHVYDEFTELAFTGEKRLFRTMIELDHFVEECQDQHSRSQQEGNFQTIKHCGFIAIDRLKRQRGEQTERDMAATRKPCINPDAIRQLMKAEGLL